MKIYDLLEKTALNQPKEVALVFERARISYGSLLTRIQKDAERLAGLGLGEDDVIAINLPNCVEAVSLLYACDYLGAIAYFIHPLTPDEQLLGYLEKAKAKALFCLNIDAKRIASKVKSRVIGVNPYSDGNPIMKLLSSLKSGVLGKKALARLRKKKAKRSDKPDLAPSVYLNSGGTNGEPKVIMLSSFAIADLSSRGFDIIPIKDGRMAKMYTVIPLFHGFGLAMGVCTPLNAGGQVVLDLKFHPSKAIRRMKNGEATVIIGVPALYNALLNNPGFVGPAAKNLIAAFVGGDSVTGSLLNRFDEACEISGGHCRLFEGYGLTETVTVTNVNTAFASKPRTVGKPLKGIKELIVDPETLKPLEPNQKGEILISGPTLMNGYFGDEELTNKTFVEIEGKRYVRTRDLGSLDEEGYLTFYSRLRRVAKVKGVMVCPADLERVCLEDEAIYECYCYAKKDDELGEALHLALVKNRASSDSSDAILERLFAKIEKQLPIYYRPRSAFFLDKLPRTNVGKVDDAAFKDK